MLPAEFLELREKVPSSAKLPKLHHTQRAKSRNPTELPDWAFLAPTTIPYLNGSIHARFHFLLELLYPVRQSTTYSVSISEFSHGSIEAVSVHTDGLHCIWGQGHGPYPSGPDACKGPRLMTSPFIFSIHTYQTTK